jgi:hypothetical protein
MYGHRAIAAEVERVTIGFETGIVIIARTIRVIPRVMDGHRLLPGAGTVVGHEKLLMGGVAISAAEAGEDDE